MTSRLNNKAIARRYFDAYSTGDIKAVMKFIDSDLRSSPWRKQRIDEHRGEKKDETGFFRAFSSIQAIVEDQIAEVDKVANRITMHCAHSAEYQGVPATGKRIVIPYMDIILFRAGKILEEWVEYDTTNILQQISVNKNSDNF